MAETLSISWSVVGLMNFTITTTNPWLMITALGMVCLTVIAIVYSGRSDSKQRRDQKQIEKQNEGKERGNYVFLVVIFRPVFFLGHLIAVRPVEKFIMCIADRKEQN